jgi:hypothetical protein
MAASTGGGSSSGGSDDDGMAVLGKLICDMNPYTEMPKFDMSGALKTGKMDVYTGNAVPAGSSSGATTEQIEVEVDAGYHAQWAFKGQAQNVNTALRVKYRFPVLDSQQQPLYWVTEYLLIGYLGSNGG